MAAWSGNKNTNDRHPRSGTATNFDQTVSSLKEEEKDGGRLARGNFGAVLCAVRDSKVPKNRFEQALTVRLCPRGNGLTSGI